MTNNQPLAPQNTASVGIIMGSDSDLPTMKDAIAIRIFGVSTSNQRAHFTQTQSPQIAFPASRNKN